MNVLGIVQREQEHSHRTNAEERRNARASSPCFSETQIRTARSRISTWSWPPRSATARSPPRARS
jgi:hypothetical protein